MKKLIFALSLFLAFFAIIFISSATACHFENVEITADCEGFTITGMACINGVWHPGVDISYDLLINYTNANGNMMQIPVYGFGTRVLQEEGVNDCKPFEVSGLWDAEFCGDVYISGTAYLESIVDSEENDTEYLETGEFVCPCACTRTPGYWKNPKKAWPVDSLLIGGVTYTRDELLVLLRLPAKEHEYFGKDVKLFHHLVAAMLNVENEPDNNTPTIQALIAAANTYFEFGTWDILNPEEMKDALDHFNNSGEYLCD